MRNATLLFLIKEYEHAITDILLGMKKRGFGAGKWNGVGGKVAEGESIEDAAKRETQEEIGVRVSNLSKVAELSFIFPYNSSWNQNIHVYFSSAWEGEPVESEEMSPNWFPVAQIPFSEMWPDDQFWLPNILRRESVRGRFVFAEGDRIQEQEVEIVQHFSG